MPMADLNDYISINITRNTTAVATTGFGVAMFVDEFTNFSERVRSYTSADATLEDGFTTSSNVYKAATKYFSQERKPTRLLVGRKQVDDVSGEITTVGDNTPYTLTINGEAITVTSDSDATAIEIAAALKVAVDAESITGLTFTDGLDGTFDISITSGTAWSVTAGSGITLVDGTSPEDWVETVVACSAENDTWYVLTAATRVKAEQEALADYIETQYRWYYSATNDSTAKSTLTTDDIGSVIKANAYDRTKIMWSDEAGSDFPELGHIGLCITYVPGQVDWMYKTIAGVTPDSFSSTVKTVLGTKGYITYETLGGVNVTLMANDLSGLEYIDTINIVDYLHARMQEGVYALLVNQPKVPYTPSGATSIQAILLGVLSDQVTIGGLAATPSPTVYVPNPRNLSQADRTGRILSGVTFEATLAGSIRYVKINGTVTI